jgi:PAS domain S-box-containing protein
VSACGSARSRGRQWLGIELAAQTSDVILPTLSQWHGRVPHVARADHLAVVGHCTLAGERSADGVPSGARQAAAGCLTLVRRRRARFVPGPCPATTARRIDRIVCATANRRSVPPARTMFRTSEVAPVGPPRHDPRRSDVPDMLNPSAGARPAPKTAASVAADGETQVHRERALLKTGALQKAILASANFSSIATDDQGVIQVFNIGAERMLGYAAADVIDRITPAAFSDPDELVLRAKALSEEFGTTIAPGFQALVFKARRGIEDIYELTYVRADGTRLPAVVSVTALHDEQSVIIGYLLMGTDNTARKRLDQALLETNLELQAATLAAERANQAKSEFLSSMSHELRSPLNAILGFAQLMESGKPAPTPAQKDSIEQILQAGWYLLELINEVLDLALIESGRLSLSQEPMSLAEVLADCQGMIEPQARKSGIDLGFALPRGSLFVRADRTRVKQIFVNLLSNAIKYNRVGGRVDVRCSLRPGGRVRVCFQDTGEGLSPDKLAQLFEPFNRLGQEAGIEEGTGIGLVVCKRLVTLMGGQIGAESTVGVGSVFWIELDVTEGFELPAEPEPAGAAATAGAVVGSALRTVLCVEDNPANLMLVARLLARRPDIRLISAKDGRRGVELAHSALPEVILMDINLPGISGVAALKMLAGDAATSHIPVIALSANAMPRDVEKGLEAGFFRYLTKPIRVEEFMDTLDLALALALTRAQAGPAEPDSR